MAKEECKTNNLAAESTRKPEIEPIQEWPVEGNVQLADFIQFIQDKGTISSLKLSQKLALNRL